MNQKTKKIIAREILLLLGVLVVALLSLTVVFILNQYHKYEWNRNLKKYEELVERLHILELQSQNDPSKTEMQVQQLKVQIEESGRKRKFTIPYLYNLYLFGAIYLILFFPLRGLFFLVQWSIKTLKS